MLNIKTEMAVEVRWNDFQATDDKENNKKYINKEQLKNSGGTVGC